MRFYLGSVREARCLWVWLSLLLWDSDIAIQYYTALHGDGKGEWRKGRTGLQMGNVRSAYRIYTYF